MIKYLASIVFIAFLISNDLPARAQQSDSILAPDSLRLTDGRVLRGDVRLIIPDTATPHVLFNDSSRFALNQVNRFGNQRGLFATRQQARPTNQVQSLIFETILLKRTVQGRIDIYSEAQNALANPGTVTYDFFAKGDGPLHAFNHANLQQALSDDPMSMRILNRGQLLKRVGIGLILAGTVVALYGISQAFTGADPPIGVGGSSEPEPRNRGTITLMGAGIALSAAIPLFLRRGQLQKAVASYNDR